ncbi:MAG TPA: helix-turn-helix transcriptional regulator [Rhizomicrobium sp.]|nr:helix-turn-helix transcriptional regulator [Rhizomicrobium sp.]
MPRSKPSAVDVFIGKQMRTVRIRAGLTQAEGGRVLGVSFQQLQKFERGENKIYAAQLFILAAHYRVAVDVFIPPQLLLSGKETPKQTREAEDVLEVARSKQGLALLYRYLKLGALERKRLVAIARVLGMKLNDKP